MKYIQRLYDIVEGHYLAAKYAKVMTDNIRVRNPKDKFKITYKVGKDGINKSGNPSVEFKMHTDSDSVMACWILIQESLVSKCDATKTTNVEM